MMRRLWIMWAVCIVVSAGATLPAASKALGARADAAASRRESSIISEQAIELATLRRGEKDLPERSEGGLATKVAGTMSRAGLTPAMLQGLSPEAQSSVMGRGGVKVSKQRATITLQGLTLPQVGGFLDSWRKSEPDWVVASIELAPVHSRETPAAGGDLPLRAVIAIEGIFKQAGRVSGIGGAR